MQIDGWKYYNHAAIPTVVPCEDPDVTPIRDESIWKLDGSPLLARWTTDFDKIDGGNWWYVIKDTPFDISQLKAKRRYEINRGVKFFEVKLINAREHKEALYNLQVAAFSGYPKKYRPTVDKDDFFRTLDSWDECIVFGSFFRETNELKGYAMLTPKTERFIDFNVLKTDPVFEKYGTNAALCAGILEHFNEFLSNGGIVCDGTRSISHETKFQEYLEDKFGFRKAYCKLHIVYSSKIKFLVKILYPFKGLLYKFDNVGRIHNINGILRMEAFTRAKK